MLHFSLNVQDGSLPEIALPPYEQLKARAAAAEAAEGGSAGPAVELTAGEQDRFRALIRTFASSADVKDQALALYVNAKLYTAATQAFREWLLAGMDTQLRDGLLALQPGPAAQEALFPYFAQFVLDRYTDDIKAYRWGLFPLPHRLAWPAFLGCCLPACLPAWLPGCLAACLPACLPCGVPGGAAALSCCHASLTPLPGARLPPF